MSHGTLPTVKIKNGDDFIIINESDFDETIHTLFEDVNGDGRVTKDELIQTLKDAGVEFKQSMKKSELQDLVDGLE